LNPLQLFDRASSTYTYVLFDEDTREALIIDPVDEQLERDLGVLREHGLKLVWSVETHAHADHITSAAALAEHAGARTAAPQGCNIGTAAVQLVGGDVLRFGNQELRALHTPGHTAGSMSFTWRGNVFTGDTHLIGGCGRTDFQSGSAAQLYRSITEVLFALPDETVVWPAHDYNERSCSTIGQEKKTNARVAGKSLAEFVKIMSELNLPKPRRIDEAVPANQASGIRHDAGGGDGPVPPVQGYAGNVPPQTAYEWWQKGDAVLVDVRTDAEREWVGFIPGAANVVWKQWPGMKVNADFDEQIRKAVPPGKKALMLCRSGARSAHAARRATELGIEAYNVLEGFEGDPDEHGQRGHRNGWRLHGLPWRQG
jgi:glyoxylase-like metal-dependent hydrolase (beta-lactamase superfamily II)/rhodanese-related sulfurtransferase